MARNDAVFARKMRNKRLAMQMAELLPDNPEDQAEVIGYVNDLWKTFVLDADDPPARTTLRSVSRL